MAERQELPGNYCQIRKLLPGWHSIHNISDSLDFRCPKATVIGQTDDPFGQILGDRQRGSAAAQKDRFAVATPVPPSARFNIGTVQSGDHLVPDWRIEDYVAGRTDTFTRECGREFDTLEPHERFVITR